MSERIERWANVYSDGSLSTFWVSPPPTLPHARIAHFVEIRDGEGIAGNDIELNAAIERELNAAIERETHLAAAIESIWDLLPKELSRGGEIVSRVAHYIDSLKERAEKAEAALERATRDNGQWVPVTELWRLQSITTKDRDDWKSRALSAESQLNDARKRHRDDTAAKLLAAEYADSNAALPAGMTTDQYWINRAKWALIVAQHLTDAAFGFPPEKEVKG